MEIVIKKLSELTPYAKNPRKNADAVKYVAASIKEFGFKVPVIIDDGGEIVAGHTRWLAAKRLGLETVPCIVADDLTPEQVKAFRLADNKTAEMAEWDLELLDAELLELADFNMEQFGFEIEPPAVTDDDFDADAVADAIVEPVTKLGDIWTLGRHRLMCGDSTNDEDVNRLMDDVKANLVVTDPPYNVSYESKDGKSIQNDSMGDAQFFEFLLAAFKNMASHMAEGGSAYVFHADTEGLNFRRAFKEAGFHISGVCVWVKNSLVLGRSPYQWQHEPVLYGWLPNGQHKWFADRKQTTVWNFDKPKRSKEHPTMKPVPLLAYPIKNSSAPNGVVMDLFGGSGSTLIACEQTDRICRTMELDPKYCDVIVKRWETLTGDKAVLNG